ncbi:calcium:proton antiporter [Halothiobacillus sp. DCM-1]|uniref:calcium:proton antiporter n=1 Tax=Halothiobacillus sp. DCM-1 TaxID=3112558 RepID=UPI00325355EE
MSRHSLLPFAALAALLLAHWGHSAAWSIALGALMILPAVMTAVHHADVVAHRVGEPYGALILALAVTVIEAALIITLMLQAPPGGETHATLTRDAIFATLMIVLNGVIGLSLLLGSLRHHTQGFRVEGAVPALSVLLALSTLTLVLPNFTVSTPDASYSKTQLAFDALVSLTLWSVFIFSQTVRHRADFLVEGKLQDAAPRPSPRAAIFSLILLLIALIAVVGLAESLAPSIEHAVTRFGLPQPVIGILIALLVLLPETLTAIRAARNNRLQTSINLALGSGLASIGLTIPVVILTAVWLGLPLELGLDAKSITLLALSCLVATLTLVTGRSTIIQGAVHLVIFAAFLFLSIVP